MYPGHEVKTLIVVDSDDRQMLTQTNKQKQVMEPRSLDPGGHVTVIVAHHAWSTSMLSHFRVNHHGVALL
jgi:hypothetical protein